MAIAGVPATAFEMARTLQTSFEFYRRSQLQSMSLPAKIRALSRLLRDNLPGTLQGFGIVAPIFAGVELSNDEIARYSRHLIMPEVGMEGQKKLKAAKVLLIGTGGLGAPLGLSLLGPAHLSRAAYDRFWSDPPTPEAHTKRLLEIYEEMMAE